VAGNETVYWFGKDEADIEPIALGETASQGFFLAGSG
jgi:hypothetical protein